jgi:hypothetical protein
MLLATHLAGAIAAGDSVIPLPRWHGTIWLSAPLDFLLSGG